MTQPATTVDAGNNYRHGVAPPLRMMSRVASRPIDQNVVSQREVPDRRFARPSEHQLRQLYRLALGLAPKLPPATPDDSRHFEAFRTSFATLSRTPKLDQKSRHVTEPSNSRAPAAPTQDVAGIAVPLRWAGLGQRVHAGRKTHR